MLREVETSLRDQAAPRLRRDMYCAWKLRLGGWHNRRPTKFGGRSATINHRL